MEGNVILIPSCEPISTVTHISNHVINPAVTSLINNYDELCPSSFITLDKALEVVTGSYTILTSDYNWRWFVLPEGPPPSNICPCVRGVDWYDILRKNSNTIDPNAGKDEQFSSNCSPFDWYK